MQALSFKDITKGKVQAAMKDNILASPANNQQQLQKCINPALHEASEHPTRCAVSRSYSSSSSTARRVFGNACVGNTERRER